MGNQPQQARTFELVRTLARKRPDDPENGTAESRREAAIREAQEAFEAGTEDHLKRCGLYEREIRMVRTGLDMAYRAARIVAAWWQDPAQKFLLLSGVPGTGKTLAAASLFLRARIHVNDPELGPVPYWVADASYRLAGHLADRPPWDILTQREDNVLAHRHLLVVDELGCEKAMSDPWRSTLDQLIDARYRAERRKTVLVTNVSTVAPKTGGLAPFRDRYGERIYRRIKECGRIVSLGCAECAKGPACKEHKA